MFLTPLFFAMSQERGTIFLDETFLSDEVHQPLQSTIAAEELPNQSIVDPPFLFYVTIVRTVPTIARGLSFYLFLFKNMYLGRYVLFSFSPSQKIGDMLQLP